MRNVKSHTDPTRVLSLWFEDAQLVFQADNRQFRVHGDVLAAASPVFRDMLSLPQPTCEDFVDGCPLIRLQDSGLDVTYFFKAIYDSRCVSSLSTSNNILY
jgi:hypothetical protein